MKTKDMLMLCIPCRSLVVGILTIFTLTSSGQQTFDQWIQEDQQALNQYKAEVTEQYNRFIKEEAEAYQTFLKEAGKVWGEQNVWQPEIKRWVQYTETLDERSAVQFEDGIAEVEVIIEPGMSDEQATALLSDGIESLVLSGTVDPIEMIRRRMFPNSVRDAKEPDPGPSRSRRHTSTTPPSIPTPAQKSSRYTVQSGDTLWGVSKRFGVSRQLIAEANGIDPDGWLKVGQTLIIPGNTLTTPSPSASAAHAPRPAAARADTPPPPSLAKQPLLDKQVAMPDGSPVTRDNVRAFAESQATSASVARRQITGSDNVEREVVSVAFALLPDHLRIRAERFRPTVSKYAALHGVYAPLIYAIIHSESSFNPRARSGVPAYGLMQLVPRSGARDAYQFVYKDDRLLSDTYLYDPDRNIELGVAYLRILDQRYFKNIKNPMSRMLCSIAAYNTGAGNVCKAFDAGTSLTRAAPVVNAMTPEQVYSHLRVSLPYEETRNYIVKVNDRIPLYRDWQ